MKIKVKKIVEVEVGPGAILTYIPDGTKRLIITDGFGKFTTMDIEKSELVSIVGWHDSIESLLSSGWYRMGWAINWVEFTIPD